MGTVITKKSILVRWLYHKVLLFKEFATGSTKCMQLQLQMKLEMHAAIVSCEARIADDQNMYIGGFDLPGP